MRFNRPPFDPSVPHVIRGGTLRVGGADFENGAPAPLGLLSSRRAAQLYRMARVVRATELASGPAPAAPLAKPARARKQRATKRVRSSKPRSTKTAARAAG
jgi:hypothetical protein